jgi:hypothetical protein
MHMGRIRILIALLIACTSQADATGTGMPAGAQEAIGLWIFYGLVYGGLVLSMPFLIFSFLLKGGYRLAALLLPAIYTLLLLIMCLKDISVGYLSPTQVLVIPSILALHLIGLAFYSEWRVFTAVAALIFVAFLVISNPSVVNYDYYRFVDNIPLENANEKIRPLGSSHGIKYVELSDGRVLKDGRKSNFDNYNFDMPVELTETDPGEFKIGVAAKMEMMRRESTAYERHKKAIFKLNKNEIVINNYRKEEITGWSLVNDQEAKDLRLIQGQSRK